jgi:hypothetical protein
MPIPQTVESNRGKGRLGDSPCPCPDWIRRLFPIREHRGGHHGAHPRPFRGWCPVTDTAAPHTRAPAATARAASETATAAVRGPVRSPESGHRHGPRLPATGHAAPPYLASMSPRASLRVEGSPPSLVWSTLKRSSIRRRGLVAAIGAAAAGRPGPGAVTDAGRGHPARGRSTDRGVAGHWILPCTGLPSRSALVAPPLRLAALRWRGAFNVLTRVRPPPGVSTACLVAATHFSVTESRGSPTRYCAHRNSNAGGTIPCTARPPMREFSCSEGPENRVRREARVGANRRRGAPAGPTGAVPVISPVAFRSPACHSSFSDDWLCHARFGEPASGAAAAAAAWTATGSATAGSAGARNGHGHGPRARRRPRTEPLHGTQTPAAATGTAISRGARRGHGSDGFLVAWASSPRMDHQRSERRPHGGQDAHRTMGSIATGGPYGPASAAGSGSATARSARARCGHGSRTRPSDTGSATDEAVAENPGQGG